MHIFPLFADVISKESLVDFIPLNDTFYNRAIEIKGLNEYTQDWSSDTYASMGVYDITFDPIFKSLLDLCVDRANIFADYHGIKKKKIRYVEAWVNVAAKEQYQEYHRHPNRSFSAIYYIKTPENSGNIVFKKDSLDEMFPLPIDVYNEVASYATHRITPKAGDLIIFKSNIQHLVEKNKSNEDRVSIAINFHY
jgi:uncharacterized protein (TIGR02466 family)